MRLRFADLYGTQVPPNGSRIQKKEEIEMQPCETRRGGEE